MSESQGDISGSKLPQVSIVVPVHDEAENIASLVTEIAESFAAIPHEIIVVDDASKDKTLAVLKGISCPSLRVLEHEHNAGQSRAIRSGAFAARADILCVLDGDGQNIPADLLRLIPVLQQGMSEAQPLGLVIGERVGRKDTGAKKLASRMAWAIRQAMFQDGVPDTGCGTKAMDRRAYLRLPFFDHQHRFLPALFAREGYGVASRPVGHRARNAGRSKYTNLGRALVSVRDLLGLRWLIARSRNPGKVRESGHDQWEE